MGRIVVILPDELENRFKSEVFKRLGMKRGNITKAIQQAIELWMETVSLAKYIDESIKSTLKEIDSNPKLSPEQKTIAREFFIRRVNELFPKYLSLVAENVIREVTFPSG